MGWDTKLKNSTKTIKNQVLLRFLLILALILSLLWLLEVVAFETIYQSVKSNEIKSVGREAVERYAEHSEDALMELSLKTNCNIVIIEVEDQGIQIVFNSSRVADTGQIEKEFIELINKLNGASSVTYISELGNLKILTYGQEVYDTNGYYYVYVNSLITPVESSIQVMTFLLLITSVISIVLTVMVSILFSMRLTKPIVTLANQAKKLSQGDTEIKFDAREFVETSELSDALNYSIGEIKKSELLQREVVANVSHEIRTPLTMIKSYAELIQDYSGDDKQKRDEHLNIIVNEVERLEYIINDILDYSKLNSNTIQFNNEEFDLAESIQRFVKYYGDKEPEFEFNLSSIKDAKIVADRRRIEQVITNLLNNAINYSTDKKQVDITLKDDALGYRLEIKDYGIGVPEEDQKTIFDRHFRAVNAKRMVVGSGIGLSIVKSILEHYGFEYGVESKVGEGSTFYVVFTTIEIDSNNNKKYK